MKSFLVPDLGNRSRVVTDLFNRLDKYFLITEKNDIFCINNNELQFIYNRNHIHLTRITIINEVSGIVLNCRYNSSRQYSIKINNDLSVEEVDHKDIVFKNKPSFHCGSDTSKNYVSLFSWETITEKILHQFFNYELEETFSGVIIITKSTRTIKLIPMPFAEKSIFSEDDNTIAIIVRNKIHVFDLDD